MHISRALFAGCSFSKSFGRLAITRNIQAPFTVAFDFMTLMADEKDVQDIISFSILNIFSNLCRIMGYLYIYFSFFYKSNFPTFLVTISPNLFTNPHLLT